MFLLVRRPVHALEEFVAVDQFHLVDWCRAAEYHGENKVQRLRYGIARFHGLVVLLALQELLDEDAQFVEVDRFGQEQVGAAAVAVDAAFHIGQGRHEDDGGLAQGRVLF